MSEVKILRCQFCFERQDEDKKFGSEKKLKKHLREKHKKAKQKWRSKYRDDMDFDEFLDQRGQKNKTTKNKLLQSIFVVCFGDFLFLLFCCFEFKYVNYGVFFVEFSQSEILFHFLYSNCVDMVIRRR